MGRSDGAFEEGGRWAGGVSLCEDSDKQWRAKQSGDGEKTIASVVSRLMAMEEERGMHLEGIL